MGNADRSAYLRKRIVRVRFNDCEIEALDEMRGGCPRATYLRQLLLAGTRVAGRRQVAVRCASMDAIVRELNRIGVNVNQLARFARGLPVEEGAVLDAAALRDGMRSVADAMGRFSNCNDCVLHNEHAGLGLGGQP